MPLSNFQGPVLQRACKDSALKHRSLRLKAQGMDGVDIEVVLDFFLWCFLMVLVPLCYH